ncbi:MAG: discoidin domain-containing protein [Agriterribacter sp.]
MSFHRLLSANIYPGMLFCIIAACHLSCTTKNKNLILDHARFAAEYYKEDAQWYLDNIPFFECSDKQMEQVYYYRWKLYKAHIRNVGANGPVITEFINDVTWDIDPYSTINAAAMHHIYEGRWLKNDYYMNGYINYLYHHGGNNRQYSESIADAAYARFLVNRDSSFLMDQLDSMEHIYNAWYDHYDSAKNMYYIPAMPDATEYTIASIDASGGKEGFAGGEAFRPTINSYMYGNALAIAHIATMKHDTATANIYLQRAAEIKANVLHHLWNDSLQHFIDRYKVDNNFVHYWHFIRGRELAGMIPWYFNLPEDADKYTVAWKHVLDTAYLLGAFGLRTNEPSYEYYFKQFVIYQGQRGSQWNGPSWPYQTSQVITGMANLLNNYKQKLVTNADYVKLLRLYTQQHYLPDGNINLVENYDPNLGGPIVYYYWSNHYNHSTYNNLVISGLCGIRPSEGDTLDIHPLVDSSIHDFCLSDVQYHGHALTVLYDEDGTKYQQGKGVTIFVDGKKVNTAGADGRYKVFVGKPILHKPIAAPTNYALNITRKGYPIISASGNGSIDSLYQVVDGRIWYFPEITNRWATWGSPSKNDWVVFDFGKPRELSSVKIYPVADDKTFALPDDISIEYRNGAEWLPVTINRKSPDKLTANTGNQFFFTKISANNIRINFVHTAKVIAISEIECYDE